MIAQIHDRLEDLVTNSAQLIFVGSDTLAQQQQNLENFLTQQDENVEIAFVQVGIDDTSDSLRGSICAQLMHVNSSGFQRPLNELLHELNHIPDPVLICLTHAQNLSESMLTELWNLVLQSRFGANKLHLNIILFGDTQWSQAAQLALAHQQAEPPIILTNDAFTYEYQGSELDQMIAQKREAFAQRIAQRNSPLADTPLKPHFIHSKLFLGCMVSLLFVLAVMLVALQYPQGKTFFASLLSNPSVNLIETSGDLNNSALSNKASPLILTDADSTIQSVELAESMPNTAPQIIQPVLGDTGESTVELPYMTWQEALAHSRSKKSETEEVSSTFVLQLPKTSKINGQVPNNTWQTENDSLSAQLAGNLNSPREQDNSNYSGSTDISQGISKQQNLSANNPTPSTINSDNIESFIANVPSTYFVIQLSGMANPTVAQEFISNFGLENQAWYYTTQRFGGDWSVVLLNNHFSTRQDALLRINSLSPEIKAMSPFVKSAQAAIVEINRVDDNS